MESTQTTEAGRVQVTTGLALADYNRVVELARERGWMTRTSKRPNASKAVAALVKIALRTIDREVQ